MKLSVAKIRLRNSNTATPLRSVWLSTPALIRDHGTACGTTQHARERQWILGIESADLDAGMNSNLDELENALGYRFKDRALLVRALTHSSSANEVAGAEAGAASTDNERL